MNEPTGASKIIKAGANTYFMDIKKTKMGTPYLVIIMSRFKGEGGRERVSLSVFPRNARAFLSALQEIMQELPQEEGNAS